MRRDDSTGEAVAEISQHEHDLLAAGFTREIVGESTVIYTKPLDVEARIGVAVAGILAALAPNVEFCLSRDESGLIEATLVAEGDYWWQGPSEAGKVWTKRRTLLEAVETLRGQIAEQRAQEPNP